MKFSGPTIEQLDHLTTENSVTHDLQTNAGDIEEVNEITEWKADDLSHVTSKLKNASLDHHHTNDIKGGASLNLMRSVISSGLVKVSFCSVEPKVILLNIHMHSCLLFFLQQ